MRKKALSVEKTSVSLWPKGQKGQTKIKNGKLKPKSMHKINQ